MPRCEPAEFDSPSVADSSACIATECWPLPNEAADPERGFLMAAGLPPAFRTIRDRGLRLVAYWHSHPQGDAFPSARDRAENLHPDTPHVIVGLPKAIPGSIRAWLGPQLERELRIVVDDPAA